MKHILLLSICFAFFAPSEKPSYRKLNDGVVVFPEQATGNVKQVRLQVISKNIIRVTASALDSFHNGNSLMVLPQPDFTAFTLTEEKDKAILTTSDVRAEVSLSTGEVVFKDPSGRILLQEQKGGGKKLSTIQESNQTLYTISNSFESPVDEAFYGLGGHQNGQINYKGEDVELVQHNIVDVVPFVYSTNNYGILWDNYSISSFGDSRAYLPLNSLQLFDRNERPGGLSADYYVKDKIVRSETENEINYEFLETPPVDNFPKDVARDGKVVWEGSFTSDVEGAHKFLVYASGYFKVWVDGKLIMDKWRQNWNPWTNKFNVGIKKGEKHKLKIEWISEGGYLAVKHLDPLPAEQQSRLTLSSEVADEINYYFIKANNADGVIAGYRQLTGKAPIPPAWAMGFWQSRERYRSQKEIIDVVKEYRKRQIPLDNIVLDWQYWKDPQWGSHEFDETRFPDPQGMVNIASQRSAREPDDLGLAEVQ
jgi:alpha-D-xyloside xylohydrolase